jgi:hypothetical protein
MTYFGYNARSAVYYEAGSPLARTGNAGTFRYTITITVI